MALQAQRCRRAEGVERRARRGRGGRPARRHRRRRVGVAARRHRGTGGAPQPAARQLVARPPPGAEKVRALRVAREQQEELLRLARGHVQVADPAEALDGGRRRRRLALQLAPDAVQVLVQREPLAEHLLGLAAAPERAGRGLLRVERQGQVDLGGAQDAARRVPRGDRALERARRPPVARAELQVPELEARGRVRGVLHQHALELGVGLAVPAALLQRRGADEARGRAVCVKVEGQLRLC